MRVLFQFVVHGYLRGELVAQTFFRVYVLEEDKSMFLGEPITPLFCRMTPGYDVARQGQEICAKLLCGRSDQPKRTGKEGGDVHDLVNDIYDFVEEIGELKVDQIRIMNVKMKTY